MTPRHGNSSPTAATLTATLVPLFNSKQPWITLTDIDHGCEKIPGYRTSTVFFTSLRANLLLAESPDSPLPSPSQPPLRHKDSVDSLHNFNQLHHPSPLTLSDISQTETSTETPNRPITPPTTYTHSRTSSSSSSSPRKNAFRSHTLPQTNLTWLPHSSTLHSSALHLLSTSASSQRHTAFSVLLLHPLNIILYLIILYLSRIALCLFSPASTCANPSSTPRAARSSPPQGIGGYPYPHPYTHNSPMEVRWFSRPPVPIHTSPNTNAGEMHISTHWFPVHVLIAWAGLTLAVLAAIRFASTMYGSALPQDWLGQEDEVLIACAPSVSCGNEEMQVIGVAVISWVPGLSKCANRKRKVGRGFIRGWAVGSEWRGQGVGKGLLKEVVRVCLRERGGEGVWFAEEHAHHARPLHRIYNHAFDTRDRRARDALLGAIDEVMGRSGGFRVRRRS